MRMKKSVEVICAEIELLRRRLNEVTKQGIYSEEALILSQQVDDLLVEYYELQE